MVEATVNKSMRKRESRVPQGSSWVRDKQEVPVKKQERTDGRYRRKSRMVHPGGAKHILERKNELSFEHVGLKVFV